MSYQDTSSALSWLKFEVSAKSTIISAQAVIRQLSALLNTGKLVCGHNDDSFDETEANTTLDKNWTNKTVSNIVKNNIGDVCKVSHEKENIVEV